MDRAQAAQAPSLDSLLLELRRGIVVLGVLAKLREEEYGYSLKRSLSEAGLEVDEGTLYPLLRRLESQGLLESRWSLGEGRPRRYYRLNASGESGLAALAAEWRVLTGALEGLLK